jgi:hypothetical protein
MNDKTTPLYVVCSPCRGVGKTLVSRLLTEFYVLDRRPVAAYDLADEGPQLADYLPQFTTISDMGDIFGQMAFFERLIADNDRIANVIDLSHRTFKSFFTVVEEIGFFEEARRRAIEPLILFIIDADPKSPEAYAGLHRLTEASLLPVCNRTDPRAISDYDAPPDASATPTSLEIPLLGFSLRALIDRQAFSFCEFARAKPADLPDALDDELRDWVENIFFQFRKLELMLGCVDASTPVLAPASRRPRTTRRPFPPLLGVRGEPQRDARPAGSDTRRDLEPAPMECPIGVPYEVLKFAPKKVRGDGVPTKQSGGPIVEMLQSAGQQLRAAENRINQLETEIERVQNRELAKKEIEEKPVEPATAARSKIDDLGS